MRGFGGSPKPFQVLVMEVPSWGGMCLYSYSSLSSRSSRHGHVNSVSSVRVEEELGGGSQSVSTSSRTRDPSPATHFSYVPLLPPHRKFKFNPRLGIDNPVLSLAEDQAQSGNFLTPGNDYLSLETLQWLTASCLLGNR